MPAALNRERGRHPGLTYSYGRPLGPHPTLLRPAGRTPRRRTGSGRARRHRGRCSSAAAPPTRTPTPRSARPHGCSGRGAAWPWWRPRSSRWRGPACPRAWSAAAASARRGSWCCPTSCSPACCRTASPRRPRAFEGAEVRCAEVIGDCDGLADLVVERYEEALHGDIRMNCDACVYRIAMPGFEDRVGAPQHPHHHPDDPSHASMRTVRRPASPRRRRGRRRPGRPRGQRAPGNAAGVAGAPCCATAWPGSAAYPDPRAARAGGRRAATAGSRTRCCSPRAPRRRSCCWPASLTPRARRGRPPAVHRAGGRAARRRAHGRAGRCSTGTSGSARRCRTTPTS